jgi:RND family efflux transporter MFP subunit
VGGAVTLAALALGLYLRAHSRINHVALSSLPKPVTVVSAQSASYRPIHTYIASLDPWVMAKVGPQYVSAYVATVLVRPGDVLKAGQVLATLDCRNSAAASKAVAASAKSMAERQVALSHQVARMKQMLSGGFASANEVEQMNARSSSELAELESLKASLSAKTLEVDDCIQRAPFDSEVSERLVDPGAYVRPSNPIVTVIDRQTIRVTSSAPEQDFNIVAPGTTVDIDIAAISRKLQATISRRAPGADATTRTVDFEIDIPNEKRELPANATATLTIPVGQPQPSSRIPSLAATLRGKKATLFVVQGDVVSHKTVDVLGEMEGQLYLNPTELPPGALVVTEGRALLEEGDRVAAKEAAP